MSTTRASLFATRYYRIRTADASDGATCFLTHGQATVGVDLPTEIEAYAPGRETRSVKVPLDAVLGFEAV